MAAYPPRFGPPLWKITHLSARRLDDLLDTDYLRGTVGKAPVHQHRIEVLHRFLHDLDGLLPCHTCAVNYINFRHDHPLPSTNAQTEPHPNAFFHWSVDAHNHANKVTGKRIVSYKEAGDMYDEVWNDANDFEHLSAAQRMRLEDHATIAILEQRLEEAETNPVTATVNLGLLVSLLVMVAVAIALVVVLYLRHRQNH